MAIARVWCASSEIEPYDMAPVENRLTISLTGSTWSIGTGFHVQDINAWLVAKSRLLTLASIAIVLLLAGVAGVVGFGISTPLRRLTASMARLASGDLDAEVKGWRYLDRIHGKVFPQAFGEGHFEGRDDARVDGPVDGRPGDAANVQQVQQVYAQFVGGVPLRHEPPVLHQGLAVVDADDRGGVSDVKDEQHGTVLLFEGFQHQDIIPCRKGNFVPFAGSGPP